MRHAQIDHPELERLRGTWGERWHVWTTDKGDGDGGSWVATISDSAAGVDMTVATDTAAQLDRELTQQAGMARAVTALVDAVNADDVMKAEATANLVRVTHQFSGRCDTVALSHADGLTWLWLSGPSPEKIGPADELPAVVAAIRKRLSTRFRY